METADQTPGEALTRMQLAAGNAQLAARRDEPERRYNTQFNSVADAIRRLMGSVRLPVSGSDRAHKHRPTLSAPDHHGPCPFLLPVYCVKPKFSAVSRHMSASSPPDSPREPAR